MGETEYPNSLKLRRQAKPSNIVFSTLKRVGKAEYPSSLTYPAKELCISLVTLRRKLIEDNSYQILTISNQYH
ncbi:hypothetical protein B296_00040547 [Ensete ventricosum]|uniref:Uncharacterized protein n=1 Tax=Ensete ventricosum TaxID=4639 RepID=A0A426XDP7_ENSVE|nr:hypothetical protein B296_00040547 [Ensete ventricosum]